LHQALDGRTRFTGSGLVKSAPGFREAYRAAAIYPDFFDKHRIRDTAAILRIGPPSLHLAVFTERFGDRVFLEFAPPMLEVLEPAFVQGTRALLAHRSIVRSFFRQIDESETATAHCSLRGVLLHRNVALSHLLRSAPASARLEARMQALADDAQGLAGIAATDRLEELLHSATTLHRTGGRTGWSRCSPNAHWMAVRRWCW
jgi:hypothetical protein